MCRMRYVITVGLFHSHKLRVKLINGHQYKYGHSELTQSAHFGPPAKRKKHLHLDRVPITALAQSSPLKQVGFANMLGEQRLSEED